VQIVINGANLVKTEKNKFLGIILSDNLSWQKHIDYISKKISKSIGILYKLSSYLNRKSLIGLYYCFIYPYFLYCNEVWGLAYATHKRQLFVLQKKALRIICHSSKYESTDPLFRELKLLKFVINQFMFRFYSCSLPPVFDSMFTLNYAVHNYGTRQNQELHVPLVRTNLTKMSIRYHGVITWNFTLKKIDIIGSLPSFTRKLKNYIINNQ